MTSEPDGGALSLLDWAQALPMSRAVGDAPGVRVGIRAVVASGVPRANLDTYWAVLHPGMRVTARAARTLGEDLHRLSLRWLEVTLRAGIGWCIVQAALCDRDLWSSRRLVATWAGEGLGEHGWLFATAGVSVDEARPLVAAGVVDEDALAMLAALRGVALPAV
ncbi:hypothetical protein Q9R29_08460 [Rothia sp. ARF10]|nr:hypothetical protein [Rothia sp. ARF10]